MNITEAEFKARLTRLSEENWKVKSLLKTFDKFEEIPKNLKDMICDSLQVKVKTVTTVTYELLDTK